MNSSLLPSLISGLCSCECLLPPPPPPSPPLLHLLTHPPHSTHSLLAVRLFSALKDLNRLITAVSKAVVPVCNAFLILLIVAAMYAILGTSFFHHRTPKYFGDFLTSLFTMFQVLSGDSWASAVSRDLFAEIKGGTDQTDPSVVLVYLHRLLHCLAITPPAVFKSCMRVISHMLPQPRRSMLLPPFLHSLSLLSVAVSLSIGASVSLSLFVSVGHELLRQVCATWMQ